MAGSPYLRALLGAAAALALGGTALAEGGQHGGHAHDLLRPVPDGVPPPSLALEVIPDSLSGYNLHLLVTNFRFSPEKIDQESLAVEGHAHLYVNGKKIGRLYGPWVHLPMALLGPGENEVRVSLNDNLHRAWANGDAAIASEVALTGPEPWQGRELILDLSSEMPPPTLSISQGESLRLEVRTAEAIELHLHGYDLMAVAAPGAPAVFVFEALHSGRFALVAHGADDLLGREEAALAYLEILPE